MDIRPINANALLEKIRLREGPVLGQREILLIEGERTLSLNDLRDEIYADAVAHGLWEGKELLCDQTDIVVNEVMEMLEASAEVIASAGKNSKKRWRKKKHFSEELADVVIACFSLAGKLGIDIDAAIRRKMEINKKRPWKHGKE